MTLDHLLTSIWLIVTFGVVVSGYGIKTGRDLRTLNEYLMCVFFWPLMLALALLNGCFYAVLVIVRIMWFAVNFIFGITGRR